MRHEKSQTAELATRIARVRPDLAGQARSIALGLVRYARTLTRYAERECNEGLTPAEDREVERLETAVNKRCAALGFRATHNGDPRGFSVKLQLQPDDPENQPYNTWGGAEDGWGIG